MSSFLRNQSTKVTTTQSPIIDKLWPKAEQFPNKGPYWRTASNAYGEIRYNCPGIAITSAYDEECVANTFLDRYALNDVDCLHFPPVGSDVVNNPKNSYNVRDPALEASGTGASHVSDTLLLWGYGVHDNEHYFRMSVVLSKWHQCTYRPYVAWILVFVHPH